MPNETTESIVTDTLLVALLSTATKAGMSHDGRDAEHYANACLALTNALVALKQTELSHGHEWYNAAK